MTYQETVNALWDACHVLSQISENGDKAAIDNCDWLSEMDAALKDIMNANTE